MRTLFVNKALNLYLYFAEFSYSQVSVRILFPIFCELRKLKENSSNRRGSFWETLFHDSALGNSYYRRKSENIKVILDPQDV